MDVVTLALLEDEISEVAPELIAEATDDWLEENVAQETGYVLDSTLTMSNAAAPADKVGELKTAITHEKSAFDALLTALEHVAWTDGNGQTYCDNIHNALYAPTSITAVYTQSGTVFSTDTLDSLKTDLVVTATYADSTTTIASTDYTLTGNLSVGTSIITVTYMGKTNSFTVIVTDGSLPEGYTLHDYLYNITDDNTAIISTGLVPNYNGVAYKHEIEFMFKNNPSTTSSCLYGLRNTTGSDPKSRALWAKHDDQVNKIAANYGGTDTGFIYTFSLNTKYKSVTKSGQWYMNDVMVADNMDTGSYVAPDSGTISIFGISTAAYQGSGIIKGTRVYSLKVTEISSGTVVAYMKPCTNLNNEAGFYDVVRREFYTTSNTINVAVGDDE